MPNGRPWTKAEIDELVRAARVGGSPDSLAVQMDRTPEAVFAKARKLSLRLPFPA
jgi:hypothetical protein